MFSNAVPVSAIATSSNCKLRNIGDSGSTAVSGNGSRVMQSVSRVALNVRRELNGKISAVNSRKTRLYNEDMLHTTYKSH